MVLLGYPDTTLVSILSHEFMTKFYGLTGGIGSGKSTVTSIFAQNGVPTLDLDQAGKHIIEHDSKVLRELVNTFGTSILNTDYKLDKQALALEAFKNSENTQKLNAIMHPRIVQAEEDWRDNQIAPIAIIEASVIIESSGVERMDALIVVISDFELRKKRVLDRGLQSHETFNRIIQQQCTDEERIAKAKYLIENNGSLKSLEKKVTKLLNSQI